MEEEIGLNIIKSLPQTNHSQMAYILIRGHYNGGHKQGRAPTAFDPKDPTMEDWVYMGVGVLYVIAWLFFLTFWKPRYFQNGPRPQSPKVRHEVPPPRRSTRRPTRRK